MKVMNNWYELALLCTAVHHQEGIKINVNKCGLFLKFSFLEKDICSQHGKHQSYFLLSLACCVKLCCTLRFINAYSDCKR